MIERLTLIVPAVIVLLAPVLAFAQDEPVSRATQLRNLQQKQILVPMWGWPAEKMASAARRFGYEVVNSPHGNNIEHHQRESAIWADAGLDMIVRPILPVKDPFDPEDVRKGIKDLLPLIELHSDNPHVLGFSIAWGLYGEGGFPFDYEFSEKARAAFNAAMETPDAPLPDPPAAGQPGSLRHVKWMEFRSQTLRDFRARYVKELKKHTDKLVGTWSEFYPLANHQLNMGDAPGADFLFYDLSFGDVTVDQTRAFGESHGEMQHIASFEEYRRGILPLMAKSVGEGAVPMGFQFPMRRGHATDFLSETTVFIDEIDDEYSLRIGPDIRALIEASGGYTWEPEVAVVYQSFAASALPASPVFYWYQNSVRQMEGLMRQMGVALRVIPYEHLATADLSHYKLVVIPDPLYLSEAMRDNLKCAQRILYSGEYLLTHHEPDSADGDFMSGFTARTVTGGHTFTYLRAEEGLLARVDDGHPFMEGVSLPADTKYPADQMVLFNPMPEDSEVLVSIEDKPVVFCHDGRRIIHVANRLFNHTWHAQTTWLEEFSYRFLHNLLTDSGVRIRVETPPTQRVKEGFPYGSYGVVGRIAYNDTAQAVTLTMTTGEVVLIPANGWTTVGDKATATPQSEGTSQPATVQ